MNENVLLYLMKNIRGHQSAICTSVQMDEFQILVFVWQCIEDISKNKPQQVEIVSDGKKWRMAWHGNEGESITGVLCVCGRMIWIRDL